jgi:hypothetical protein
VTASVANLYADTDDPEERGLARDELTDFSFTVSPALDPRSEPATEMETITQGLAKYVFVAMRHLSTVPSQSCSSSPKLPRLP